MICIKESVYYASFNADDLCMGYFNTFNCVNYLEHKIIFQTTGDYQKFVRWDRSQLYRSTLVQYLS